MGVSSRVCRATLHFQLKSNLMWFVGLFIFFSLTGDRVLLFSLEGSGVETGVHLSDMSEMPESYVLESISLVHLMSQRFAPPHFFFTQ